MLPQGKGSILLEPPVADGYEKKGGEQTVARLNSIDSLTLQFV